MADPIACTPREFPPDADDKPVRVRPGGPKLLAAVTAKLWKAPVRLTVSFLDNPEEALRKRLLSHMNAWNKYADIEFTETREVNDADVRISREPADNPAWGGYWSFVGTDILDNQGPFKQTMNLEGFTMRTPDSEFFRVVRHETGHTLGFPHEHMREELVSRIDRQKAIDYYGRLTGWSARQVIQQVLTPLDPKTLTATLTADPKSIMAYQVPGSITKDGQPIIGGLDIDETDYQFCGQLYPK